MNKGGILESRCLKCRIHFHSAGKLARLSRLPPIRALKGLSPLSHGHPSNQCPCKGIKQVAFDLLLVYF